MIPLMKPIFTKEMKNAAVKALEDERFVLGESVYKFEEKFAKYIGTKHAVSASSGTAALQLSLIALNMASGDKVITTPMSFIATSNSIIHAGGIPVFSDIDGSTGNLDTKKIKPKDEKGIIPVHLYGQPCDMDGISGFMEEGLFVVEDACQAHGATYKGKKAGSMGHAGCFSFYPSKNMMVAGDGGMITTDIDEVAERAIRLRDCGRKGRYEHDLVGFTYRLNTINAAIGLVQLRYIDEWNKKRQNIADVYGQHLPEEMLLGENPNSKSVYHVFVVKADDRDGLADHLKSKGIETGVHYPIPIHLQPAYAGREGYFEGAFPKAEAFSKKILSLPMFPEMKKDEVKIVAEAVQEYYK
jgi:perosamine synthetase